MIVGETNMASSPAFIERVSAGDPWGLLLGNNEFNSEGTVKSESEWMVGMVV
jgi:hypothetical protein